MSSGNPLSMEEKRAIDRLCDAFESDWKDGQRPEIERYLADTEYSLREPMFMELLRVEIELLRARGDEVDRDAYRTRFPDSARTIELVFAQPSDGLDTEPRRASIRCPNCYRSTSIPCRGESEQMVCGQCGCSVSLVPVNRGVPPRRILHFHLVELLGTGASGAVWKAMDTELNRTVAIKIPRRPWDAAQVDVFVREARAAARLKHPNIVAIHEIGQTDELIYIVTDFVDGISLRERLAQQPMTTREAVLLCRSVAQALHHAHEHGIVHRDLKPSNILLDRQGEPVVADFGLAKHDEGDATMTVEGMVLGTPAYMSPEQARGQAHTADRRTDVYALGVLLFETLTGARPFRGSIEMLVSQILNDPPPSPRSLNRRIPRDLETVCLKCIEKEPRNRYLTAHEVAEELERFLSAKPIVARPVSTVGRGWRWCRRNPGMTALVTLIAFILITVAVSVPLLIERSRTAELLLLKIHLALAPHILTDGWSREAWEYVEQARDYRADLELRSAAATTLAGWDAFPVEIGDAKNIHATSVALDERRHRLLVGTGCQFDEETKVWIAVEGASLWEYRPEGCRCVARSSRLEAGPVAFQGQLALQIVPDEDDVVLRLWNVEEDRQIRTLHMPDGDYQFARNERGHAIIAIGPDGRYAGLPLKDNRRAGEAVGPDPDPQGKTVFWDTLTGEIVVTHPYSATALCCFGDWVASASESGWITINDLSTGEEVNYEVSEKSPVKCLAIFAEHNRRFLAIGQDGGTLILVDLTTRHEINHYFGHHSIETVAFSPDGTRVAAAARDYRVSIVDVRVSRPVLSIVASDYPTALAFSDDGRWLVGSMMPSFQPHDPGVFLWKLDRSRGLEVLTGMANPISRLRFSPDSRYLAALSDNWQLGIWDLSTGHLVHQLRNVPMGSTADNAGFAFDAASSRFVFCTGTVAKMWQLDTGQLVDSWTLVESGLNESVAYQPGGDRWLILRTVDHNRRCQILELLSGGQVELKHQIRDFEEIYGIIVPPDGRYVVIQGRPDQEFEYPSVLCRYETESGGLVWDHQTSLSYANQEIISEPTGDTFFIKRLTQVDRGHLIDSSTGDTVLATRDRIIVPGVPGCGYHVQFTADGEVLLLSEKDLQTVIKLRGRSERWDEIVFSPDGKHLAWGTVDGTVTVANLEQIRARLATVGLGWPNAK